MYKLTVVAGSNRGSSYALGEGDTTIGRVDGNTIVLLSSKVSKQHCQITVSGKDVTVKDLGSSNGTFVNGILTKLKKLNPGDRVSVGEFVLELSEPQKAAAKKAPAVRGLGNAIRIPNFPGVAPPPVIGNVGAIPISPNMQNPNQPPKDLKGKILWILDHQLMPVFYDLNLKHEWKVICLGLFAAFMIGNLIVSVYPLLEANRTTIVKETGRRASFMAKQIADQNSPHLAARAETKAEIASPIENGEGVRVAVLVDLDSRIIAPGSKLNQYLASGGESLVAVSARDWFRNGRETGFWKEIDNGTAVVAVEPVKVMSPTAGRNMIVAMAVVSIDTSLSTPDIGEMGMTYAETMILTGLLGGAILLIMFKITLRPFQVLNEDMDKALKGDIAQVSHQYKIEELNALWDIINSAIQRIPRSESTSGGLGGLGGGGGGVEEFAGPLQMIGSIGKFGLVVFDSSQKIHFMNAVFEEISGIRSDSAIGQGMSDVARDQALGALTQDMLNRVTPGNEGLSEDFDFSGISYKMYASAFGSSGGAKGYVFVAVRVES